MDFKDIYIDPTLMIEWSPIEPTPPSLNQSTAGYIANTFVDVRSGVVNDFNPRTDVLHFYNGGINSLYRDDNTIVCNLWNNEDLTINLAEFSQDDIIQYTFDGKTIYYANVGYTNHDNRFQYAEGVDFIGSSDHEDTLDVSTYDGSVDLRENKYINIDNIDARNSSTKYVYIIGNAGNNKIYGAAGNTLWGEQGNDELYGSGAGDNTYLYGVNEGNDVICNSVESDKVDLYNVSLSDLYSYDYDGSSLRLNMYNGGSLTIVGSDGASNFVLADRSEYGYNRSTDTWFVKA